MTTKTVTEPTADVVREVVEEVWTTYVGVPLDGRGGLLPGHDTVSRSVGITGEWTGRVDLSVSDALGRRLAGRMFRSASEALSVEDVEDAVGELANMVGGSVKSLVGGTCALTLPVHPDELGVDAPVELVRLELGCDGEPVTLVVGRG